MPYELKRAKSLAQATRIFTSVALLPLASTLGLAADQIYPLGGEKKGYTSYDQLVSSVRKNNIPWLPVRHATKDTLAYLVYSFGTSGLPKGTYLLRALTFIAGSWMHRLRKFVTLTLLYSHHDIPRKHHLCHPRSDDTDCRNK